MEKKLKKRIKIHWVSILILIVFLTFCYLFGSYIIKVPTKNIYIKYSSITKIGFLKTKKKGRKKTIYVRVRALDGSKKTAKIKIKIR